MNLKKFIEKYNGKKLDFDKVSGAQCVDLAKQYLYDCFGINPGAWGNAHCYYDNFNSLPKLQAQFTRIQNTPDFVPIAGDIVVWDAELTTKGTGHIAIATGDKSNTRTFETFDQNWPAGSGCKKVQHNYNHVAGALRPKNRGLLVDKPIVKKGQTITLANVRGIYKGAGDKTGRKQVQDLTANAKLHSTSLNAKADAYLKRGTKCMVKEVKTLPNGNLWVRVPSGWLCVYEHNTGTCRIK